MIMGQSSNNRLDAMNIVIIAGVPESEILWPPSNLQTLGTIPILNIVSTNGIFRLHVNVFQND